MKRITRSAVALLVLVPGSSYAAEYTLKRLGLADAIHTRSDGHQDSTLVDAVATGFAVGTSTTYKSNAEFGRSAWWSDGIQTVRLGLFDGEHTSDVFPALFSNSSAALGVNRAGVTVGNSVSYKGQGETDSAWHFDGRSITRLGILDALHRGPHGEYNTRVQGSWLNDAGDVIGYSTRYAGGTGPNERTAWLYRGGEYTMLGLNSPEFLFHEGMPNSDPVDLNEAGQVVGNSEYVNLNYSGFAAWITDGVTTTPIGLVTPETINTSYWTSSLAERMNEAGQVVGGADVQLDSLSLAGFHDAIWFYDGATSERIGLHGDGYIYSPTGAHWSRIDGLSEGGHVVGTTYRWDGTTFKGHDAWQYHQGATTQLGLTSGAFTSSVGARSSVALQLNDAGHVVGSSAVYAGEETAGDRLWLYDGNETIELGLMDAAHTSNTGKQVSHDAFLLANGDVGGYSHHYIGAVRDGITLWYFDYSQRTTEQVAFVPSPYPSSIEGSWSAAAEDGTMYGYAKEYEGITFQDWEIFRWTSDEGRESLLPLIEAGPDQPLFEWLLYVTRDLPTGVLYGTGQLAAGGHAPFRLDPVRSPDFNGDGMVDAADYVVWRNGLGINYTFTDYANWRKHFGEAMGDGSLSGSNSSAPEPATWIFLAMVIAALTTIDARQR
jgi:hypothetical protein